MLALGLEILTTTGGATGGVAIVVVVEGGVLIVDVGVDDEFVDVIGVVGVVVVVVGVECLAGCLDLRAAAEILVGSFAVVDVSLMRDLSTPRETSRPTPCALSFVVRAVVEATFELFPSVRNVVPGEVAATGITTTANIKTLRAIASDALMTAQRARRRDKASGEVIRRVVWLKKPGHTWPVCPCILFMPFMLVGQHHCAIYAYPTATQLAQNGR